MKVQIFSNLRSFLCVILVMGILCPIISFSEFSIAAKAEGEMTEAQVESVIKWATNLADNNATAWISYNQYGDPYLVQNKESSTGNCANFVHTAFIQAGFTYIGVKASGWYQKYWTVHDGFPPKGSIVLYDSKDDDWGHVAISLGDGNVVQGGTGTKVQKTPYDNYFSNLIYKGWVTWENYELPPEYPEFERDSNGVLTKYTGTDEIVEIPDFITAIGNGAFLGKQLIKKVIIPDSVKSIGNSAFLYCDNLQEVVIGNSVESIDSWAFSDSGIQSIKLPESLTTIGVCAFEDCHNLEEIIIPKNVQEIGHKAFISPKLQKIQVNSDNSYYSSKDGVLFSKDKTILYAYPAGNQKRSYSVLDSVKQIGAYAFYNCKNLERIILPDSLESILYNAFEYSSNLTYINIPQNVEYIDCNYVFGYTNIKKFEVDSRNKYFKEEDGIIFSKDGKILYFYPPAKPLSFVYKVPNNVESIGYEGRTGYNGGAFIGSKGLKYLIIPDSVTNIGGNAFYGFESLSAISWSKNITSIPAFAFRKCNNLISITIPYGITDIGFWAFSECHSLENVFIPKSVSTINNEAFDNSKNIKTIHYAGTEAEWDSIEITGDSALKLPSGCKIIFEEESVCNIRVACPVDVEIYNSSDEIVGRVVNNQVDKSVTSVSIWIDETEGAKYITAPGSDTYTIKAIGNGSGKMDYSMSIEPMNDTVTAEEYSVNDIVITPNTVVTADPITERGIDISSVSTVSEHSYIVDYRIDNNNEVTIEEIEIDHAYSAEWVTNGTSHWHECVCGKRIDEHEHDSLAECSVCGYRCDHSDCTDVITYPTKTTQGYTTHTCNICGEEFSDTYTSYVPFDVSSSTDQYFNPVFSWNKYEGAILYVVREITDDSSSEIANVTETTYTLPLLSEGSYTFKVSAYLSDSHEVFSDDIVVNIPKRIVTDFTITPPDKVNYFVGDSIKLSGGTINVSYNYGKPETIKITEDMVSGFDSSSTGKKDVTVSYGDVAKSFSVSVKQPELVDIFIASFPKTDYLVGENLDLSDAQLCLFYENAGVETIDITSDMISEYDSTTIGEKSLTVSYGGKTATFVVNVKADILVDYGLDFTDGIGLVFYEKLSQDIIDDNSSEMVFSLKQKTVKIPISEAKPVVVNDNYVYAFTCPVAAAEMTDEIQAQIVSDTLEGDIIAYSIQAYVSDHYSDFQNVEHESSEISEFNAIVSMLNYGTAAQMYFRHNTENLANNILDANEKILSPIEISALRRYRYMTLDNDSAIEFKGMTIGLQDIVVAKFYFNGEFTADMCTINGNTITDAVIGTDNNGKYIAVRNIAPDDYDTPFTIAVGDVTISNASVFSYLYTILKDEHTALCDIAYAMYAYNKAVEAYIA